VTIETEWNKVVLIIILRIIINVMNLDISGALFAAETTMAFTPQQQFNPALLRNRDTL
jgi:hypothetical protein